MTFGLLRFFLRAKPVQVGGIVLGAAVITVVLVIGVLQSLTLSGSQRADSLSGRFENAARSAGRIPIGGDVAKKSTAIIAALSDRGAADVTVGYSIYLTKPDSSPTLQATIQEGDWAHNPFPVAYRLQKGAWAAGGGVTVSKFLAKKYPLGSTISFFGGALRGRVTGIMLNVYSRDRLLVLVPPGSMASLASLERQKAQRFSTTMDVDVYWNGQSNGQIRSALRRAVENPGLSEGGLGDTIQTRELLENGHRNELIEVQLAALLIPLLAGLLSARFGARFVSRIRLIMHRVGVPALVTGRAGHGAVAVANLAGTVIGLLAGYVLLLAIRPLIDLVSNSTLGPIVGVAGLASRATLVVIAGTAIGLAAFGRVPMAVSRVARRRQGLTLRRATPAIALALAFIGVRYAQGKSFDDRVLALLAFGLAITALGPFVLDLVIRAEPDFFSGRLGVRRLRADRRASGWVVVGVGTLLVTSFGLSTYLNSSVATANATTESLIPPHQVHLEVPAASGAAEKSIRDELEKFVGVSNPVSVRSADVETNFHDGALLVLRSVKDVERYTATRVTSGQRDLLENGGVLRTRMPTTKQLILEAASPTAGKTGTKVALPAMLLTGLDPSYRSRPGLMLTSTAQARDIPVGSRTLVYTGVSPTQIAKALRAPGKVGFDPSWIATYKAPTPYTEPMSVTLAAGGLALVGALLLVYYAAASASALRPHLAGLRTLGMRRSWLMSALGVQLGAVVGTVLVVATTAAAGGVALMLHFADSTLELTIPWRTVGAQVLVTLVGAVAAVAFASRRLRPTERME